MAASGAPLLLLLLLAGLVQAVPHQLAKRQAYGQTNNALGRLCDWFNIGCNPTTTQAPTPRAAVGESAACGFALAQIRGSLQQQLQNERAEINRKLDEIQRLTNAARTSPNTQAMVSNFCTNSGFLSATQAPPTPQTACVLGPWSQWVGPVGFTAEIERTREILTEGCGCPDVSELRETVNLSPYLNDSAYASPNVTGQTFSNHFLNKSQPRDILFILDSSGSILSSDFEYMRQGLIDMMDMFCGGVGPLPTNNHVAVTLFSTDVTVLHRFSDPQNPATIRNKVHTMVHQKGNTCTGDALLQAANSMFTGARPGVPRDVLLITDGQSNCGADLSTATTRLSQEASVYCLGVGLADNDAAKNEIASVVSGNNKHIFSISKFIDFKQMLAYVKGNVQSQSNPCQPIVVDKK